MTPHDVLHRAYMLADSLPAMLRLLSAMAYLSHAGRLKTR